MSRNNQAEGAKSDTKRDEARTAHHVCFFDDMPATALLNGVYVCPLHATCNACLKPLTKDGLTCQCDKYGYSGHFELLWCSESCLDHDHPEPLDQDWE